ncbi:MAG: ATP-binding cassette domain-containing protein [Bdellovibrionota bacterium]
MSSIHSLALKNVTLTVGSGVEIIKDTTLELPTNKVVWIRGISGSGKSTLLKMLCGLVMPQIGEYNINGTNMAQSSFEEFLPLRCKMGYSFDFGGLLNNRTIVQNLALPLMYHESLSPSQAEKELKNLIADFQLDSFREMRPSNVVGGVRKATCVARAFVLNPEMVLLDDPTTGLRNEVKVALKKNIQDRLASGLLKHVFIVTEDFNFIEGLYNHVISIEEKMLSSYSTPERKVNNAS